MWEHWLENIKISLFLTKKDNEYRESIALFKKYQSATTSCNQPDEYQCICCEMKNKIKGMKLIFIFIIPPFLQITFPFNYVVILHIKLYIILLIFTHFYSKKTHQLQIIIKKKLKVFCQRSSYLSLFFRCSYAMFLFFLI